MKKAMVNVPFDEEKLTAARLYMEQKELSFEDEMIRAAEALYSKYVPANVREFIELRAGQPKAPAQKKPPRPSSAVGAGSGADGDPE